jgi:type IV pilus assembly protein PilC
MLSRELSTLYRGGIPVLRSLELLAGQPRQRAVRAMLTRIADVVREGGTLAQAVREEPKRLPVFFIEMVASGEQAGQLDTVLRDLAGYYDEQLEIRRDYVRGLVYPACIVAAAIVVIPYFKGLFLNLFTGRGDVGAFTWRYVLGLARRYGPPFVVLVVLARLGVLKWLWAPVGTYVWPFKTLTRKLAIARFFRSMAILLDSGMGLIRAIERSAAVTTNPSVRADLLKAVPAVQEGRTLEEAFAGAKYIPPMVYETLCTAEQSGTVVDGSNRAAKLLMEEFNHTLHSIARAAEAIAIVILGYLLFFG